jgi:predicted PurR-regulated permease PerM
MERERIVQVFFFGFFALMAYELYQVLDPFLSTIAWAILLAFLAHPALLQLNRVVRNRTTCAIIMTIVVALGVILPAIWLSARLVAEAQSLYVEISGFVGAGGEVSKLGGWLRGTPPGARLDAMLVSRGISLEDEISKFAVQGAKVTSDYVIQHGGALASNVASTVIHFALALFTFFYLLRDGESYYEGLRELTPLHEEDKTAVFETLRATLSSVMRGLMLTALLDGVSIGLAYFALGVPYWAFLAILTAACGLLPFGGTTITWVPVAIYLGVESGWVPAAVLVVWAAITLLIVDNFIKPIAMKHGTGLPALALFFGLAGGIEAFGPLGIFAGPAVFSVFAALLRVYRRIYIGEEAHAPAAPPHVEPQAGRRRIRKERQ